MVDVQKLYRKLYALGAIKGAARDAIVEKEGTLDEDAPFREYPAGIRSIPKGGGPAGAFVVPDGMKFTNSEIQDFPENWDFSQVTKGEMMFANCANLLHAPAIRINGKSANNMFAGCVSLIDAANVEIDSDMIAGLFTQCAALPAVPDVKVTTTTRAPEINMVYDGCLLVEEIRLTIDFNHISTHQTMQYMWRDCAALRQLNLTFQNSENVAFLYNDCFLGCDSLTQLSAAFFETVRALTGNGALPRNLQSIPAFNAVNFTGNFALSIPPVPGDTSSAYALTDIGAVRNLNPNSINLKYAKNLNLSAIVNVVKGLLVPSRAKRLTVSSQTMELMRQDTAVYEFEDANYTGIIALANAKGWTVLS